MAIGLLIDVENGELGIVDCISLNDYHHYLNCSTFDITKIHIGDKVYDIYCDDEGKFKNVLIPSAITKDGNVVLVGNLIITKRNLDGETISLDENDIVYLRRYVKPMIVNDKIIMAIECS